MANLIQFDEFEGFDPKAGPHCIACEAMLTDAVDDTLGSVDRAWFDRHIGTCVGCAEKLADAQRGAAWLEMLKTPRPEPGAELMARILAQTTGQSSMEPEAPELPGFAPALTGTGPLAFPMYEMTSTGEQASGNLIPFRPVYRAKATGMRAFGRVLFEPRLAMTAAMAFFSVALTLNLTGVRLNELHATDLKPANLRRGYYQASSRAVQYYDNLRVVHVMESRVEDLKQATEETEEGRRPNRQGGSEDQANPGDAQPKSEPKGDRKPEGPGPGTSRREAPAPLPGDKPRLQLVDTGEWTSKSLMGVVWPLSENGGHV